MFSPLLSQFVPGEERQPCTFKAGTLPLEPCPSPFALVIFKIGSQVDAHVGLDHDLPCMLPM
jgi:hypothetical protein